MSDTRIRLTDDEIMALSVRSERLWASPLPTVDVDDPHEIHAAARRGERSLYARDLLTLDDQQQEPLITGLAPAQRQQVILVLFVCDEELNWFLAGPNLLLYRPQTGSELLAETVSEAGVHSFSGLGKDVALAACREMLQSAWRGGVATPGGEPAEARICFARPTESGSETVVVGLRKAEIRTESSRRSVDEGFALEWLEGACQ